VLDDLDVAQNALRRIVGQTDDVAAVGYRPNALPRLQHRAVLGDPVLLRLRGDQIVGVDVLEPDEDAAHTGTARLLNKPRDQMAKGVNLNDEFEPHPLALAQLDDPVEDRFPVAVSREVVVGDEEVRYALGVVLTQNPLDIVCRAVA
jgi:hypothetical protein